MITTKFSLCELLSFEIPPRVNNIAPRIESPLSGKSIYTFFELSLSLSVLKNLLLTGIREIYADAAKKTINGMAATSIAKRTNKNAPVPITAKEEDMIFIAVEISRNLLK